MDMMADESFHVPTEANDNCLNTAKAVLADLKSPSLESSTFCSWLVKQLEKITEEAFSTARQGHIFSELY